MLHGLSILLHFDPGAIIQWYGQNAALTGRFLYIQPIPHTRFFIVLVVDAAKTTETLVSFYQTTRRYNPEDSHLRTHRRENLRS
jgi:hypothetical protein